MDIGEQVGSSHLIASASTVQLIISYIWWPIKISGIILLWLPAQQYNNRRVEKQLGGHYVQLIGDLPPLWTILLQPQVSRERQISHFYNGIWKGYSRACKLSCVAHSSVCYIPASKQKLWHLLARRFHVAAGTIIRNVKLLLGCPLPSPFETGILQLQSCLMHRRKTLIVSTQRNKLRKKIWN